MDYESFENRREHCRVDVAVPAEYVVNHKPVSTNTATLSCGGMMLRHAPELVVGAEVDFALTLTPGGSPLMIRGTVVGRDANQVRVQFADDPPALQRLRGHFRDILVPHMERVVVGVQQPNVNKVLQLASLYWELDQHGPAIALLRSQTRTPGAPVRLRDKLAYYLLRRVELQDPDAPALAEELDALMATVQPAQNTASLQRIRRGLAALRGDQEIANDDRPTDEDDGSEADSLPNLPDLPAPDVPAFDDPMADLGEGLFDGETGPMAAPNHAEAQRHAAEELERLSRAQEQDEAAERTRRAEEVERLEAAKRAVAERHRLAAEQAEQAAAAAVGEDDSEFAVEDYGVAQGDEEVNAMEHQAEMQRRIAAAEEAETLRRAQEADLARQAEMQRRVEEARQMEMRRLEEEARQQEAAMQRKAEEAERQEQARRAVEDRQEHARKLAAEREAQEREEEARRMELIQERKRAAQEEQARLAAEAERRRAELAAERTVAPPAPPAHEADADQAEAVRLEQAAAQARAAMAEAERLARQHAEMTRAAAQRAATKQPAVGGDPEAQAALEKQRQALAQEREVLAAQRAALSNEQALVHSDAQQVAQAREQMQQHEAQLHQAREQLQQHEVQLHQVREQLQHERGRLEQDRQVFEHERQEFQQERMWFGQQMGELQATLGSRLQALSGRWGNNAAANTGAGATWAAPMPQPAAPVDPPVAEPAVELEPTAWRPPADATPQAWTADPNAAAMAVAAAVAAEPMAEEPPRPTMAPLAAPEVPTMMAPEIPALVDTNTDTEAPPPDNVTAPWDQAPPAGIVPQPPLDDVLASAQAAANAANNATAFRQIESPTAEMPIPNARRPAAQRTPFVPMWVPLSVAAALLLVLMVGLVWRSRPKPISVTSTTSMFPTGETPPAVTDEDVEPLGPDPGKEPEAKGPEAKGKPTAAPAQAPNTVMPEEPMAIEMPRPSPAPRKRAAASAGNAAVGKKRAGKPAKKVGTDSLFDAQFK